MRYNPSAFDMVLSGLLCAFETEWSLASDVRQLGFWQGRPQLTLLGLLKTSPSTSPWRNTFCNFDKYILQFGQIHSAIWTNTFCNSDKYILQFGQNPCWMFKPTLMKMHIVQLQQSSVSILNPISCFRDAFNPSLYLLKLSSVWNLRHFHLRMTCHLRVLGICIALLQVFEVHIFDCFWYSH